MDAVTDDMPRSMRNYRLWIITGTLVCALCGAFIWSRAVRSQQQRWIEAARESGLLVHDEPYRDEWQGPIDLNPYLRRLGAKYLIVLVRADDDAERLLNMTDRFNGPMVTLYTTRVSTSLVDEIERRFPSAESIDWKKRIRPIYQGESLARRQQRTQPLSEE